MMPMAWQSDGWPGAPIGMGLCLVGWAILIHGVIHGRRGSAVGLLFIGYPILTVLVIALADFPPRAIQVLEFSAFIGPFVLLFISVGCLTILQATWQAYLAAVLIAVGYSMLAYGLLWNATANV